MNIFETIFDKINDSEISGLTDELKTLYIFKQYEKKSENVLVVVNTLYEATKIFQMLKNYTANVLFFPMDDFITSEVLAVSPEFKAERLVTLDKLLKEDKYIVVTNLMGYLRFLPSSDDFKNKYLEFKVGADYDTKKIVDDLYNIGYERDSIVNKTGEMAIRGFVIDIFPINAPDPIRLEFWGNTLDTIRYFDINSQMTTKNVEEITIAPNTEFLTEDGVTSSQHRDLIKYIKAISISKFSSFNTIYINANDLKVSYDNLEKEMCDYCISNEIDPKTKFMHDFKTCKYDINLSDFNGNSGINVDSYTLDITYKDFEELSQKLKQFLKQNKKVIICMSSRYQANNLIEQLNDLDIIFTNEKQIFDNKINVIVKKISEGFIVENSVVISENDLFHKKNKQGNYKTNFKLGSRIKDITKIEIGDYIVHSTHGIGKYCGIKTIKKNNLQKDYIQIEYRDGDKLYIPVEKIELISKYSSKEGFIPRVNKLGTNEWEKTKLRARNRAHEMASELLKLYAARETLPGFSFKEDDENQISFEREFQYDETPDQAKAIIEIKKDMESPHPMDRLVCGDVGYGKTEVAFRTAFKAILSGKQVALLCPTTILSKQHYQNALERFKSFPVNIELLNRFVTTKKANEILENIKNGKIDFIIGTHRILNDKVEFKDLGLLIIDEEQRFGVAHKEKIKQHKNNLDVLTLSATPIPRTLQLSMANIRSLSLIETPPSNRMPVQTYVIAKNNNLIKEAIYKELSRNGQVFLLYNHVDSIESKAFEISELVKDARVAYAHGQMNKEQLENIMIDFTEHKYDVLVCTTIIESGIDIPNANTLIVMDADKFGLSQLYQIRGRVGRTDKIAYCYLMYDNDKILSEIAMKRLKAIKEFTELGSGFSIAMRDLSIRGAGDILGSEQAGFIDSVGVELFIQMLNEEVSKLNGTYVEEEESEAQPLIDVSTSIDDNYVEEEQLKIIIHKKINEIDSYDKLLEVKNELEDRFGKLDDTINVYMHEQLFEHKANKLNIKITRQTERQIEMMLNKDITSRIDGEALFMSSIDITRNIKFGMRGDRLIITLDLFKLEKHFIYYLVKLIDVIEKAI